MGMKKTKKTIAVFILCSMLFVSSGLPVRAGYWTENYTANAVDTMIDEAWAMLQAMILKALKEEAIKTLQDQVEKMVSGASGGGIIADYEEFIYSSIRDEAETYLSDFFSSAQASVAPGEREMLRDIEQALEQRLLPSEPVSTLHEIVQTSDPVGDVFDQRYGGGVKALLSYQFGDYNNPFSAYVNAEKNVSKKVEQMQESAKAEVVAGQGFETMVKGNKVMPGSVYQDIVAQVEGAPIDMITNATNWQEVIISFATSLIGSAIKNGIETTSDSSKTDKRRVERTNKDGYPGIQNDIYLGL